MAESKKLMSINYSSGVGWSMEYPPIAASIGVLFYLTSISVVSNPIPIYSLPVTFNLNLDWWT